MCAVAQLQEAVAQIPDQLTFSVAASVPIVFCTAYYALVELARLQEGESVPIHSGAGGVGQAAIQTARLCKAEIFVTVGTEEKKRFLTERYGTAEDHIFSSRNTMFATVLLEKVGGVDVVLNSLSGEGLRASWECIKPFGRFVELGKTDILSREGLSMAPFSRNITFSSVDLELVIDKAKPVMRKTFKAVIELLTRKQAPFQALDLQVYRLPEIGKAFRLLQGGKSIGKVVVEVADDDVVPVSWLQYDVDELAEPI